MVAEAEDGGRGRLCFFFRSIERQEIAGDAVVFCYIITIMMLRHPLRCVATIAQRMDDHF